MRSHRNPWSPDTGCALALLVFAAAVFSRGMAVARVSGAEPGKSQGIPQTPALPGGGEDAQAKSVAFQEIRWRFCAPSTDKPVGGLAREVVVSPRSPREGQPVAIIVSTKNATGHTLKLFGLLGSFPRVMLRDATGRLIPWAYDIPSWYGVHFGTLMATVEVQPGCAFGQALTLNPRFAMLRPGRYTGIVDDDLWGLPARFAFEVREKGPTGPSESSRRDAPAIEACPAGAPFTDRWRWAAAARREDDKLALEAALFRAGGDVSLVVSLKNIVAPAGESDSLLYRPDPRPIDAVAVAAGARSADYQILVRNAAGQEAPLPEERRAWWAKQAAGQAVAGRPVAFSPWNDAPCGAQVALPPTLVSGEAVGALLPLGRLYPLRVGQDYEVLVMLPRAPKDGGPLAAGPVRFRR